MSNLYHAGFKQERAIDAALLCCGGGGIDTLTGCSNHGPASVPVAVGDSQDSTIYFYRPYSGIPNSPSYEITESGAHVGMLRDGGYFVLGASPGVHRYAVRQGPGE